MNGDDEDQTVASGLQRPNKMSHDITHCALSCLVLFSFASCHLTFNFFFRNEKEGFVQNIWTFLLAKGAIWQLGSFRAAAKEVPDRMWPFQLFLTYAASLEAIR